MKNFTCGSTLSASLQFGNNSRAFRRLSNKASPSFWCPSLLLFWFLGIQVSIKLLIPNHLMLWNNGSRALPSGTCCALTIPRREEQYRLRFINMNKKTKYPESFNRFHDMHRSYLYFSGDPDRFDMKNHRSVTHGSDSITDNYWPIF